MTPVSLLYILLLAILHIAHATPSQNQGGSKDNASSGSVKETKKDKDEPFFVTQAKELRAMQGDTVLLPCRANNTGKYLQAWKKDIAILTAGKVKVSPDERLNLVGEYYDLEIRHVTQADAGTYVCQMATLNPIEISHTLVILIPPIIQEVTSGGLVEVKKGFKVVLECKTTGNPPPSITWTRKNNLVVAGKKSVQGSRLVIEDTNRHHAGVYMCTADNGVGEPQTREITVNILYAPEIEVERGWVHTGLGQEATLACIVHAHPSAEVKWFRWTLRLESTERRLMDSRGSRNSLIIRNVQQEDLANYTCQADNTLGKTKQDIVLSGKPLAGVFKSSAVSKSRNSYNISWSVNSYSPVEEYRLYFRKEPLPGAPSVPPAHLYASRPNRRDDGSVGNLMRDWTELILPGEKSSELTQEMSHLLRNLEPATSFQARVHARNKFGWNVMSEVFRFSTLGSDGASRDPTPEPAILPEAEMRDLGVKSYSTGAPTEPSICLPLLLLALALLTPT